MVRAASRRPWRLRFDHIGGWVGEPMPIVLGCERHGVVGIIYDLAHVEPVMRDHYRTVRHTTDPTADPSPHPMDAGA